MDKKMNNIRKKYVMSVILVIAILAAAVAVSLAWFFNQRSLKTAASLISPYTLRIGAGSNESIEQLDMGNIDVSNGAGHKDYVICVYGNPSVPYVMQLAHTTNIGFSYSVYYASAPSDTQPSSSKEFAEYTDVNNKVHYFSVAEGNTVRNTTTTSTILMNKKNYININNNGVADNTLKWKKTEEDDVTKGSYDENKDNVQKNAFALYMQSDTIHPTVQENNYGEFIHYYIVRVSWGENIKNDKETDIVYITVSAK